MHFTIKKPHQRILLYTATLAVILLAVLACRKESFEDPVVLVGNVSYHETDGIVFHGRITEWGNQKIIDHGFIWDTKIPLPINAYKVSLGPALKEEFSAGLSTALIKGQTYNLRAYLVTEKGTVLSFNRSFIFNGTENQPAISSIHPMLITWGDTISIRGKYFSHKIKDIKAFVGIAQANIVSASDTLVDLVIPENLDKLAFLVSLNINGNQAFSQDSVRFIPPLIEDFSPKSAVYNQVISIEGKYFPSLPKLWTKILIGGKESPLVNVSPNLIQVRVPAGLHGGYYDVEVNILGQAAISEQKLYVAHPAITDFFPREATWNDTITIEGTNFSETPAQNTVKFNGFVAKVVEASKDQLKVLIPISLIINGTYITVSINNHEIRFDGDVTLMPPQVYNFSPVNGWIGDLIEINGKNFYPEKYGNQIHFNDVVATIESISNQKIRVFVPSNLTDYENNIRVKVVNQPLVVSQEKFQLNLHEIADVDPSGSRLNHLEIRGTGFNATSPIVKLGSGTIPVVSRDFSSIKANINFGPESGPYPISVTIAGREVIAPGYFQLYEPFRHIGTIPSAATSPPIVFQLNDRFFSGGSYFNYNNSNSFFEYFPETNTWKRLKDLPVFAQYRGSSFTAAGNAYLVHRKSVFQYDPEMDQWLPKNSFPGPDVNFIQGVSAGDQGYVIFGSYEFYRYDSHNDSWTRLKDHPEKDGSAFFYNEKVFTIGPSQKLWGYNASADNWEIETDFLSNVWSTQCSIALLEDLLFISGGNDFSKMFCYDLQTRVLKRITPLPKGMSGHISIPYKQKIHIGGGKTQDLYLFDPDLLHPSEKL